MAARHEGGPSGSALRRSSIEGAHTPGPKPKYIIPQAPCPTASGDILGLGAQGSREEKCRGAMGEQCRGGHVGGGIRNPLIIRVSARGRQAACIT